jgi:hypothetical protein
LCGAGYFLFSLIVQPSALDRIDERCRDHAELFCKEEIWRRLLPEEEIASTRFLFLWFLFCGVLSSFLAYGSVLAMVIEVSSFN